MNRHFQRLGLLLAGAWFGGAVFFSFVSGPAFFAEPMLEIFRKAGAADPKQLTGLGAMVVLERYFLFHYFCGVLVLAHAWAGWQCLGLPAPRWRTFLLLGILALGLSGGLGMQPHLQRLHGQKYNGAAPLEMREQAARSFARWHGVSQITNLLMVAGLGVLLVGMASGNAPSARQFR